MTYLTPDERESRTSLSWPNFEDIYDSHAALDEMARKMREAICCLFAQPCSCMQCTAAREYDEMIGDETPDTTSPPVEEHIGGESVRYHHDADTPDTAS